MADPYCLAMVLCDGVHRDPGTGKHTILGTFSNIIAAEYPTAIQICIYLAVTDGIGQVPIRIQIVDGTVDYVDACNPDDNEGRISLVQLDAEFQSPLMVLEGIIGQVVSIPKEGIYHCELWAGTSLLMSRRITAIKQPAIQQDQQEGEE